MQSPRLFRTRPRRARSFRSTVGLLVVTLVASTAWLGASPAVAAGDGVLDVQIRPMNAADSSTITSIGDGQYSNRITYEVQYSCGTAACEGAQVQLSPLQPDPYGVLPAGRHLLTYDDWTPPAAGGTMGGSDSTGRTISLGDLAAGDAGTFTVTYRIERQYSTPGNDSGNDVPNGAFYPDGFQIQMAATISSETATGSVTNDASAVRWNIGVPSGPTINAWMPSSVRVGEDVAIPLTMNPGNMVYGSGANVTGSAAVNAAGNYTVTYKAPAEATIVNVTRAGQIDPTAQIDTATNTITWQIGTASDPVYAARGGWGLNAIGGFNGSATGPRNDAADADTVAVWRARVVTLNFDGANFDDADATGCNFATSVQGELDASVTYLDADRTTKTASQAKSMDVACWDAFGNLYADKRLPASQTSRLDGAITNSPYWVSALNVPGPGVADRTNAYWQIAISNRGNVPGVAVIEDNAISHDHIKVYRLRSTIDATVEWTATDGTTTTTGTQNLVANTNFDAAAGTWFTGVRVTTDEIAPGRVQPSDSTESWANFNMYFRADSGAAAKLDERRLNTATVQMTYPGFGGAGEPEIYEPWTDITDREELTLPLSTTVQHAAQYTAAVPNIGAAFTGAPVVDGGGTLSPGTQVTFEMRGATGEIWPGTQIRPQTVFLAPAGWDIVPGSAVMGAGAPAGVTFDYQTKTVAGVPRQVVVATWPSLIAPSTSGTENWPTLTVKATPTTAASTATNGAVATVWAGDASGTLSDAINQAYNTSPTANTFNTALAAVDAGDVDSDGNDTEEFAAAASAPLTVTAVSLLTAVKEICVPDAGAADGCAWVSDPDQVQIVPTNADDVKYRITLTNDGTAGLTDVVAYDVLPHVGDTSLLASASPRGSQFSMTLQSVASVTPGLDVQYSASTNPDRPEVNPFVAGTIDDWGPDPVGKRAVRMAVPTLAAGGSVSLVLTTAVSGDASADRQACNTAAVDSSQTLPTEPRAVCLQLAEADLRITLSDTSDLYADTTRTLDYAITNLGGSASAPASVSVSIPSGVTVTDLDVDGWSCEVVGGGTAPVAGAASLTCHPVDGDGDPRELALNAVSALSLPIDIADDVTGTSLCFPASVDGPLYDPEPLNNTATGCRALATPDVPALRVVKSAALTTDAITPGEVDEGDTITYTFEVFNDGPGIAYDVSIDDALSGLSVVAPASVATIAVGGSATFTATYVVDAEDAENGSVQNSATADYTPPTPPGGSTPDEVTSPPSNLVEVPVVIAEPELAVTKSVDPDSGTVVDAGQQLEYTLTFENVGYVDAPVDYLDDLSGVLDDATLVAGPDVDGGLLTATVDADGNFEITGTLEPGESESVSYTVQVRPRAERGDDTLSNFLLADGQQAPDNGACDPSGAVPCTANLVSGEIDVVKSVDADGEVEDGDTVTYTLQVTNIGLNDAAVDLVDHLDNVLDDATFGAVVDDGGLLVERDGNLLRISGTLTGEQVTTVVYTVKVKAGAAGGNGVLINAVANNGVDVDVTACGDDDVQCTSTPVAPIEADLPDTGNSLGLSHLLAGWGLLILGGVLVAAARSHRRS